MDSIIKCLKTYNDRKVVLTLVRQSHPVLWDQALNYIYDFSSRYVIDKMDQVAEHKISIEKLQNLVSKILSGSPFFTKVRVPGDFISAFLTETKMPITGAEDMELSQLLMDFILYNLSREQLTQLSYQLVSELDEEEERYRECRDLADLDSKPCQKLLDDIKKRYCGDKDKLHLYFDGYIPKLAIKPSLSERGKRSPTQLSHQAPKKLKTMSS